MGFKNFFKKVGKGIEDAAKEAVSVTPTIIETVAKATPTIIDDIALGIAKEVVNELDKTPKDSSGQ